MDPEKVAACAIVIALSERRRCKRKRRVWTKQWLLRREEISFSTLLKELQPEPDDYRNFLRMDEETFEELLILVTPHIERQTTKFREPVSARDRLSVALRYLATGN